ncbi:CD44 antigen isoform X12 [Monodelphis domestica]|uniref:CD44 antigen isoform X12 n=1 Tax=Monodelphis domestica TaxID=13616 RepID=UPI0024E1B384|nr:CD44 antigen isoform X12 [Monodelphis domestica]
MDSLWTRAIWGLLLVQLSLAQIELNLTCRYAGVYHVEKNGRYSISRTEAPDLCKAFNSTLPTLEQMERALSIGFETCRYGFIEGHVVIPRKTPRFLCAANNTGVYILASNTSLYDTYCFNASAPLDAEDCSSVSDIPSVFEGQVTIGIVNPDGTRYTKKGEYRTNPDDINFNYNQDDDVSSGSAGERSTMGSSTIIQTSYPDVMTTSFNGLRNDDFETSSPAVTKTHSIPETTAQEQHNWMWSWFVQSPPKTEYLTTAKPALTSSSGTTHKTTAVGQEDSDWFSQWLWPSKRERQLYTTTRTVGMDSTTTSERLQPTEEREDETEKFPSYSGSGIDDDEDFVNHDHSSTNTAPHHSTADPNEGWIEDYGTTEQSPMATPEQNHPESTSRPRTGLEDGHEHSTAPSPTSFTDGETDGNFPEDSTTPVEDSISNFPDTNENTTHSSGAHMPTELPGMTEPTVSGGFASDNSGPDDSYPHRPRRPAVTGYSTPFPEGNQGQSGQTTDNRPRKAQIPGMFQLGKGRASDGETPQISVLMNDQRDQKENGHQGSFLLPFQSTEEGSKVDFIRAEQPNSSPLSHG